MKKLVEIFAAMAASRIADGAIFGLIMIAFGIGGCTMPNASPIHYLQNYGLPAPGDNEITVCNAEGCEDTAVINISPQDWQQIKDIFSSAGKDAEQERRQIAIAIGRLEELAGRYAGTSEDKGENKGGRWGSRQLECRAESVNTTSYLLALEKKGLLRWHHVGYPAIRASLWRGIPVHNSAIIVENQTGADYAVDSWFYDNGMPAVIVPLKVWLAGYRPDNDG